MQARTAGSSLLTRSRVLLQSQRPAAVRMSAAAPAAPAVTAAPNHNPNSVISDAPKTVVVAIDGPAAAGKGTLAVALAARLNLAYLDTGLLYRAVGYAALQRGLALDDEASLAETATQLALADLSPPSPELFKQLRSEAVGGAASKVSVLPKVRAAVGLLPRAFAAAPPKGCRGVVLDGRDVGTVLFPDAPVKLYVTASDEVRAGRRHAELKAKGSNVTLEQVLQDMRERDARDSARAVAPLRPAPGAHILDTSAMGAEEALEAALRVVVDTCPQLA